MDPTESMILDISKININDWNLFLENNEVVGARLDNLNSNFDYIDSYKKSIDEESSKSNTNLGKIENATVKSRSKLEELVPLLTNTIKKLREKFTLKSYQIMSTIVYAEEAIKAYNNGTTIDEEKTYELKNILRGSLTEEELKEGLATSGLVLSGFCPVTAGLLLAEVPEGDIEKVVHKLTDAGLKAATNQPVKQTAQGLWNCAYSRVRLDEGSFIGGKSFSGAAVATYVVTLFSHYFNDEGEFTEYDVQRMLADAGCSATVGLFSSIVAASLGGGLPGFLASVGINLITRPIINLISDAVSGENTADSFTYNNKEYTLHENGLGKDNTPDVDLERIDHGIREYQKKQGLTPIADEEIFKKQMYVDTGNFVKTVEEIEPNCQNGNNCIYTQYGYDYIHQEEEWNQLKAMIKNASSAKEATEIYDYYYTVDAPYELKQLMDHLKEEYDFDPAVWWESIK